MKTNVFSSFFILTNLLRLCIIIKFKIVRTLKSRGKFWSKIVIGRIYVAGVAELVDLPAGRQAQGTKCILHMH